jgi:poly(A) polymerase Pap1
MQRRLSFDLEHSTAKREVSGQKEIDEIIKLHLESKKSLKKFKLIKVKSDKKSFMQEIMLPNISKPFKHSRKSALDTYHKTTREHADIDVIKTGTNYINKRSNSDLNKTARTSNVTPFNRTLTTFD